MEFDEAISYGKLPSYFKKDKKSTEVHFKKGHNYYCQIQGQLHIADKDFCICAVWTSSDHQMKVEKIWRDDTF